MVSLIIGQQRLLFLVCGSWVLPENLTIIDSGRRLNELLDRSGGFAKGSLLVDVGLHAWVQMILWIGVFIIRWTVWADRGMIEVVIISSCRSVWVWHSCCPCRIDCRCPCLRVRLKVPLRCSGCWPIYWCVCSPSLPSSYLSSPTIYHHIPL
jgi:hypothetical protein